MQQPVVADYPETTQSRPQANGGIAIKTTRDASCPLHMESAFSPSGLPAGAVVQTVETRVCGQGGGSFYEVYGPYNAEAP